MRDAHGRSCTHEVVGPGGEPLGRPPPAARADAPPAKEYPFRLDPFQSVSCNCLEAGESVLVSAHTSAGKTVVAEYAIAMALRDGQRVVYTSPLKALSNQKYRELREEFGDVGLMTGDVTIDENASCLVMTTEILRSMLYAGSEVVREVAWVVFDEIHYLRDKERGVVWEETIILVPDRVRFVFLSATIPNAREFAGWVASTHQQPCHVVYTDYRPTPLQHYLFPSGGDGLYLVVDDKSTFRQENFQRAIAAMGLAGGAGGTKGSTPLLAGGGGKGTKKDSESDIYKIVKLIMERGFDPVIVFAFSKVEVERLAMDMSSLDLNTEEEKRLIDGIFGNAMECLSAEDRRLPQIVRVLPLLRRGIGIHHSGLLPILKETVEVLFQEGLLKCLFATETFSTGLNMPAKTVVFTSPRKFDGQGFRWITGGEYIQMSGRAGRRGLDDRGIVILMLDSKMEPAVARGMVLGTSDPLYSSFHLSYNMIVNMMRTEGAEPEALVRQSYRQFQADQALPQMERYALQLEKQAEAIKVPDEAAVTEYVALTRHLARLRAERRSFLQSPDACLGFLQPGRLVSILRHGSGEVVQTNTMGQEAGATVLEHNDAAWGVLVNHRRLAQSKGSEEPPRIMLEVLVSCNASTVGPGGKRKFDGGSEPLPLAPASEGSRGAVILVSIQRLDGLSAARVVLPQNLKSPEAREKVLRAVAEIARRFSGQPPTLDPESDLKVDGAAWADISQKVETVKAASVEHAAAAFPSLPELVRDVERKEALQEQAAEARREAQQAAGMILSEELKGRRRMLRRLGHVDSSALVQLKGHVAAEVASADELVLTEMIFDGTFGGLSAPQIVALLSCFVWSERLGAKGGGKGGGRVGSGGAAAASSEPKLPEELLVPFRALRSVAKRVGTMSQESKLDIDLKVYVDSFRHEMMEAAAAWTAGKRFRDVMKLCNTFEGSLVRGFRRLEEVLRQLVTAAQKVGEQELAAAFEEARVAIKRDVVFAASLYL